MRCSDIPHNPYVFHPPTQPSLPPAPLFLPCAPAGLPSLTSSRTPPGPWVTMPAQTWLRMLTTWGASSRILKGAPSCKGGLVGEIGVCAGG